jgi:hypothetical protein
MNSGKLSASNDLISTSAKLTVSSSKYAYITNAFKSDYDPTTSGSISFTIDGITNSPFRTASESFEI